MIHPISYYEQQLLAIYNTGTRLGTMQALSEMRTYLEDNEQELMTATDNAIAKLNAMTDDEFEDLDLVPDFME